MKAIETISYISIAVIVVSLFFIGTELTGFASTDTGDVNVTIVSSASIVFTAPALLDLGEGSVGAADFAIVNSIGTNQDWTGSDSAAEELVLENDGNVNVSFTLKSNLDADGFIGGTTPYFRLRVTNATSCTGLTNFTDLASEGEVNGTEKLACSNFGYLPGQDKVTIDAQVRIGNDATGANQATITATATEI